MGQPLDMNTDSYFAIPRRVFLDTSVVNLALDYGGQIHNGEEIPEGIPRRVREDIDALIGIFATGQRAFWQMAISPQTYREVTNTSDPRRLYHLEGWFAELWHYWREIVRVMDNLPTFIEAEEARIGLLASGLLDILPDLEDRVLVCDAVVYRCDAFCTRDWHTILKHRKALTGLPLRVLTPREWWEEIKPWGAIWL